MQNPLTELSFQKIQSLRRHPQTRSLMFEPCLHIDHRRSLHISRAKPNIYPDWWPNEPHSVDKTKKKNAVLLESPVVKNTRVIAQRQTIQDAHVEAQGPIKEDDGWFWKFPKKMVDENTQTDESFSQQENKSMNLLVHDKVDKTKSTPAIWIPWSEEKTPDKFSEAMLVEKSTCPKKERKPTTDSRSIKIPIDDYKIQKIQTNADPDFNLLDICTRFLASPVLQILDLTVLDKD